MAFPGSDLDLSIESGWRYLKQELKPYPGRNWMILRMTLAAVLMMLWVMVFRIPSAALGVYYTLLISRESTGDTLESAVSLIGAIGGALAIILLGIFLFTGSPLLHFLWVGACLLLTFFFISTASQYRVATGFGFLMTAAIPLWDLPANVDLQLSLTLYSALSVLVAATITVVIELIFAAFHRSSPLEDGLNGRIETVSRVLAAAAHPPASAVAQVRQFSDIGTGLLRRNLLRLQSGSEFYARQAVLIGLVGRLVDLTAVLLVTPDKPSDEEQRQLAALAVQLDRLRATNFTSPAPPLPEGYRADGPPTKLVPLLSITIELINQAIEQQDPENEYIILEKPPKPPILKRDAFTNPEHVRFALRGAGAAMICYVLYHLFDWKGVSSGISTCMITALSTAGSSRQKQILRFLGAITGGLLFGILSQSVLLPAFDSIVPFCLMFTAVTAFSAWIATSSPRISYLGLQIAFAFDLVQLRTFGPAVQLTPARDNVDGIILGLFAMWIFFDQAQSGTAAMAMRTTFLHTIRLIMDYLGTVPGESKAEYLKIVRGQRDAVNENFSQVRILADAVLFEFNEGREEALKWRAAIHIWQPELRTFFLMQITLAHMRLSTSAGRLSPLAERLQEDNLAALQRLSDLIDSDAPYTLSTDFDVAEEPSPDASHDAPIAASSRKILSYLTHQVETSLPRRTDDMKPSPGGSRAAPTQIA
ncbi:FUSC family protein [Granulicella arctica]|uniref:FUSC family protein n=1 Tax=Granulicella arctica TaxID=940613 RepID=UPI0021E0759F|nr:FUSC family protein [Granulicella arctica]